MICTASSPLYPHKRHHLQSILLHIINQRQKRNKMRDREKCLKKINSSKFPADKIMKIGRKKRKTIQANNNRRTEKMSIKYEYEILDVTP